MISLIRNQNSLQAIFLILVLFEKRETLKERLKDDGLCLGFKKEAQDKKSQSQGKRGNVKNIFIEIKRINFGAFKIGSRYLIQA